MGNWGTMGGVMASIIKTGRGPPRTWVHPFLGGISYPRHPIIPSENHRFEGVQAHPKRIGPYSSLGSMIIIIPFQNQQFYPFLWISLWFLQIVVEQVKRLVEEVRNKKHCPKFRNHSGETYHDEKNLISWVEKLWHNQIIFKKKDKLQFLWYKLQVYQVWWTLESSSNKSLHPVDARFPVRQPETFDSGSLGDAPFAQELHAEGGLLACRALTSMVETINHGEGRGYLGMWKPIDVKYYLVGGWTNPFEKMGIFPNFRGENTKCLKPPPIVMHVLSSSHGYTVIPIFYQKKITLQSL